MYLYQVIDTVTTTPPGSIIPDGVTLGHWRFLAGPLSEGGPSVWSLAGNTLVFATCTALVVTSVSVTAAYALSRLNMPGRGFFLGGLIVLHAFPTITLIVAVFLILQYMGLYDTLTGVILVKVAFELPFGIWIMKGFYDSVPWKIRDGRCTDGAIAFTNLAGAAGAAAGPAGAGGIVDVCVVCVGGPKVTSCAGAGALPTPPQRAGDLPGRDHRDDRFADFSPLQGGFDLLMRCLVFWRST